MNASRPNLATAQHGLERRATIIDVARLAGVSPMTVSRALKGASVSSDKVIRIKEAVRLLDYRPNEWARSLTLLRSRHGAQRAAAPTAPDEEAGRKRSAPMGGEHHAQDASMLLRRVERLEQNAAKFRQILAEIGANNSM
jgi:hypothetical protein